MPFAYNLLFACRFCLAYYAYLAPRGMLDSASIAVEM